MSFGRCLAFALAAGLLSASVCGAAELPAQASQAKKPKQAEAPAKTCNIVGIAGVLLDNGVCVRMSGYVGAGFSAGQVK